jgi:hypothetical protein
MAAELYLMTRSAYRQVDVALKRSSMDEPLSQPVRAEERTTTPADVWAQLDPNTRARVLELFAHSAYNFVAAQYEAAEEGCDVSFRRDAEGDG